MDASISAKFSPGPWWGFNGVDVLELTPTTLVRRRRRLLGPPAAETFELRDVRMLPDAGSHVARDGAGRRIRLTLELGGRRRVFTARAADGEPFARELARALR